MWPGLRSMYICGCCEGTFCWCNEGTVHKYLRLHERGQESAARKLPWKVLAGSECVFVTIYINRHGSVTK